MIRNLLTLLALLIPNFASADNFYTIKTYGEYIDYFWGFSSYLFISIAIIIIIIGSFFYMFSSYSNNGSQLGKELIQGGVISIVLLFGTKVFYSTLITKIKTGEEKTLSGLALAINNIIDYLTSFVFILLSISIIYSIYIYLSSFGDENKVKLAKKTFLYSISGAAIILVINLIVSNIQSFF